MARDSDWEEAYRRLLADGRKRLGPPPTAEKVEALYAGELPEAEAEKVRELLAYYPEMAFPPDMKDESTAEERAAERARLRAAVGLPPEAPATGAEVVSIAERRRSRRQLVAAAVVILLALGGLAGWVFSHVPAEERILHADGQRSVSRGTPEQTPIQLFTETRYRLKFVFRPERPYRNYRLDFLDSATRRSIWSHESLERQADGAFPVKFSTKGLAPGRYEFVLSGVDDQPQPLAMYTVRLSERPRP